MEKPTAEERAMEVLEADAEQYVLDAARTLVEAELATWQWDPQVPGVVGLVVTGTNRAVIVVYGDSEWEVSADLDSSPQWSPR